MPYDGLSLHKVSSKCGIFAETDANTLVKTGVPVEEIIASLFEAVVYQNLATLTKGNAVQIEGALNTRQYTPQDSDATKSITEVRVYRISKLDRPAKVDRKGAAKAAPVADFRLFRLSH